MIKILRKILGLCNHKWETFKDIKIMDGGYKVGNEYHLRCTKCGNIKVHDTYWDKKRKYTNDN